MATCTARSLTCRVSTISRQGENIMCMYAMVLNEARVLIILPFSVSHPFEYDLKENKAETGSDITLSIDLVGGTTFKILGMMLCDG